MRANGLELFNRLEDKQKNVVLQITIKWLVVNYNGDINTYAIHSFFTHLSTLAVDLDPKMKERDSSFRLLDFRKLSMEDGRRYFDILHFSNKTKLG